MQLEIGRLDRGPPAEPFGGEEHRRLAGVGVRLRRDLELVEDVEAPTQHLRHQLQARQLGGEVFADEPPVAQNRDAIADAVDLIEEVADEQHRDARRFDAIDDLEQLVDFVGVEAGGRFVEHQDLGVDLHGPGDRHELLNGEGVVRQR